MAYLYDVLVQGRSGRERVHRYAAESALAPGDLLRLEGRDWLVERVDPAAGEEPARAVAKPARYRLVLRHPDGREELGAFRRLRPDAPRPGHAFATLEDGRPVCWQVVEARPACDGEGEPYLELVAERDFGELEAVPDHELEHALAAAGEAEGGAAALARAGEPGLAVELVALEAGEEPDWEEAARFIEALVLEEIEDDLLEACGVDPDADPPDTWLATVKERLRQDLDRFRADVETDRDQIEEWDFRDGRVLAAVGRFEAESDPHSGYGWMCRLLDSGALAAAGFTRVRKADLAPP